MMWRFTKVLLLVEIFLSTMDSCLGIIGGKTTTSETYFVKIEGGSFCFPYLQFKRVLAMNWETQNFLSEYFVRCLMIFRMYDGDIFS